MSKYYYNLTMIVITKINFSNLSNLIIIYKYCLSSIFIKKHLSGYDVAWIDQTKNEQRKERWGASLLICSKSFFYKKIEFE